MTLIIDMMSFMIRPFAKISNIVNFTSYCVIFSVSDTAGNLGIVFLVSPRCFSIDLLMFNLVLSLFHLAREQCKVSVQVVNAGWKRFWHFRS